LIGEVASPANLTFLRSCMPTEADTCRKFVVPKLLAAGWDRIDIHQIIARLADERQLFHSEADFQHALAWKIHELYPDVKLRLEVPSGRSDKRERIDILASLNGRHCAVELKYKKRKIEGVFGGERYVLSNDGAQDIGRYDFIKDVARLERYVVSTENTSGWAVLLTNDDLYWKESPRGINSAAFFLHEGRQVDGGAPLSWHERTGEGSMRHRTESFNLRASYTLQWKDYSSVPGTRNGTFRYLALPVTGGEGA
jgi:hypothetical protein